MTITTGTILTPKINNSNSTTSQSSEPSSMPVKRAVVDAILFQPSHSSRRPCHPSQASLRRCRPIPASRRWWCPIPASHRRCRSSGPKQVILARSRWRRCWLIVLGSFLVGFALVWQEPWQDMFHSSRRQRCWLSSRIMMPESLLSIRASCSSIVN